MLEGSTLKQQIDKRQFLLSLQNNADIIIQLAQDFTIQIFNAEAQTYFNILAQDVIGENFFDCFEKNGWPLPQFDTTDKNATIQWQVIEHYNKKIICDGYLIIGKYINRKTEVFLKNLIAALPGHVYWKDANGVYLGSNDRQAHSLGFEKGEDVIGKTDYDLIWKSSADFLRQNDREVMEQGVINVIEESGPLHGVERATFISHKVPLRDENDQVIGILGLSLDITDIKRTEAALQEALQAKEKAEQDKKKVEIYLENIISNLPCHVYWKDRNGNFLGCNELQARSAGFSSVSEMIGKNDDQMPWREQADIYRKNDRDIMQTGVGKNVEEACTLHDGKTAYFLANKVPLKDREGNVIGILGISTDITEHKNNELELVKAKEYAEQQTRAIHIYLENVIAHMPGHVYWKDINGVFLGCNDSQAQSAGLKTGKDVIGKTDYELSWKDQANVLRETDYEIISTGKGKTLEEPSLLADGTLATFLTHKVPLKDDKGKIIGILGISVDITARKHVEKELLEAKQKAEIANQAKSEFIANISHDIRTPLNGILGIAQVMRMRPHYQEQVDFFDDITTAVNTLLHLIEDILDFAKLEAGKLELTSEPFDLRMLIEEIINMTSHQANQKNIKLIFSYPDSIPHQLIGDARGVRRILINLINNAIKFTEQGYVQVKVTCLGGFNGEVKLQLVVKDTGIGIPGDKLGFIFDRFSRIDPSYKGRYKGTGLGLSIVKQLIDKLNGEIKVESSLEQGTTFYSTLPFKVQDMAIQSAYWQKHYNNLKILIVDDHQESANAIAEQLSSIQCKIVPSRLALEEIEGASREGSPYQIALVNDELKDINLYDYTNGLRNSNKYGTIMSILLMKPCSLAEIENIKKAGFFNYLIKPIQPTELLNSIRGNWRKWQTLGVNQLDQIKILKPKILLIEDDLLAQRYTSTLLSELNCEVKIAGTGAQAFDLLSEHFDLVFMDIGLPDTDGYALTKKIRLLEDKSNPIPIVALTAHVDISDREKCLVSGMNDFLKKPATLDELTNAILEQLIAY